MPVQGFSAIVPLFILLYHYLMIWFMSCWMFHGRLCYSWWIWTLNIHSWEVLMSPIGEIKAVFHLFGSMSTVTTALARCKKCLFLRELPLFKWINRVCRFIRFKWNLGKIFVSYYCTKACWGFCENQKKIMWHLIE